MEIPVVFSAEETDLIILAMRVLSRYDDTRVVEVSQEIARKICEARAGKFHNYISRSESRDREF